MMQLRANKRVYERTRENINWKLIKWAQEPVEPSKTNKNKAKVIYRNEYRRVTKWK